MTIMPVIIMIMVMIRSTTKRLFIHCNLIIKATNNCCVPVEGS